MNSLTQKLEYLKWLKLMGIEYYFSDKKDSGIFNRHPGSEAIRHPGSEAIRHPGSEAIRHPGSEAVRDLRKPGVISIISNDIPDSRSAKAKRLKLSNFRNDGPPPHNDVVSSHNNALDGITSVEKLKEALLNFNGCRLKDFAQNTVFSDGTQTAKIMLVGEAPGAKEDEKGIPFCGESGQLLDTMMASIGLSRKENIYITNTIFWRPPANRRPTKEEIETCRPFLEKHIALINPKLIVCVGSTAVAGLLGDKVSINTARNKIHHYQNQYLSKPINTMAIFHPAYLLRQSSKKKDTWFDLMKIKEFVSQLT